MHTQSQQDFSLPMHANGYSFGNFFFLLLFSFSVEKRQKKEWFCEYHGDLSQRNDERTYEKPKYKITTTKHASHSFVSVLLCFYLIFAVNNLFISSIDTVYSVLYIVHKYMYVYDRFARLFIACLIRKECSRHEVMQSPSLFLSSHFSWFLFLVSFIVLYALRLSFISACLSMKLS